MNENNVLVNKERPNDYYPLFIYPHAKLREPVKDIIDFGPELNAIIDKMQATMYMSNGVGLAANQVGIPINLFIIDISEDRNNLKVFINTKISYESDPTHGLEGCLSFPGVLEDVVRFNTIKGTTQDKNGNLIEFETSELEAIAIQHELDHLHGVLLWDKVSRLKQRFIQKTIKNTLGKIPSGIKGNTNVKKRSR